MGGASFVGNVDRYEVGDEGGHCGSSFWEWRWGKRRREVCGQDGCTEWLRMAVLRQLFPHEGYTIPRARL